MPYTPDATLVTQPADTGVQASTAAAEFRTIKLYMRDVLLAGLNTKVTSGGALGTPSSGTLTNCSGLPVGTGISGLGAGIAAALAIAVGTAGAPVVKDGALGTPSGGSLANCTGLPVASGISGLAAGIATFLATPTSANLLAAVTDEDGTGTLVFSNSPILTTPTLGVASATSINKVALTAPATGATLTIADGKTLTASNSITLAGTDGTTMTFPVASASIGYLNVPQNSQSAAYTTVLSDAGKHILHPSTDANARTFTIDSNANVPYPIGTTITFVNQTSQLVTIGITADTLTLANSVSTGNRTLAQNGMATAMKVGATSWIISGSGLT